MATRTFNATTNALWSVDANWSDSTKPTTSDTAVIAANCTCDENTAVLAVLTINASTTLTVSAGVVLTTADFGTCTGAGTTLTLSAGSSLINTGNTFPTITIININGTSVAPVTLDNTGSGTKTTIYSSKFTVAWCNSTDFLWTPRAGNSDEQHSLSNCDIDAGLHVRALTCDQDSVRVKIRQSYIHGASTVGLSARRGWAIEDCVFGYTRTGSADANAVDIAGEGTSAYVRGSNIILTAASGPAQALAPQEEVIIDNLGHVSTGMVAGSITNGAPGIHKTWRQNGTVERSTDAKRTGDYGAKVTPTANISANFQAELSIYLPVESGDDIAVSVYGFNHALTAGTCAEVEIDPEGAWFTPTTDAPSFTQDTWVLADPTASTAGGTGAIGMVRVVLRVKEYASGNYFYWGDFTATVGGVDYTVDFAEWSQGVPVASRVATGGGGTFMPRPIQVGL